MKKTLIALAALICSSAIAVAQHMSAESKLRYADKIIERYYVDSVNTDKMAEEAIIAMLKTLDPHSQYSNAEETRELTEPLQGNFSGIGIQFNMLSDTLYVIQPVVGGPCEKAGIVAGDRILAANDTLISGVKMKNTDVMKILRGPKGSKVTLRVLRQGGGEPVDFRIVRDDIPIYSVDASYMAAPGVGYVKLSRFAETSADEVAEACKELRKQGMTDLILDLDYNGGGYLNAACDLAEMMLSPGDLIVYTKGDKVSENSYRASSRRPLVSGKIVIMVNQNSASASEILAGAVQDHDRGVIVGRRTFGKGLVQRPFPFPDGSMIRLTIARYYTPSGRCIQKPYTDGGDEEYELDILNRLNHGELTNPDSVSIDRSVPYYTLKNHRTVYGGGGIMPDHFVPLDTTENSAFARDLLAKGVYNLYCVNYVDSHRKELRKKFRSEDDFMNKFEVSDAMLKDFLARAEKEGVKFDEEAYQKVLPTIKAVIKGYIGRDIYSQSAYYRAVNPTINEYNEALRVITDDDLYNSLLMPSAE